MKFVVDRSTWRFGGSNYLHELGETRLLGNKGFMCCLGHCLINLGIKKEDIDSLSKPDELDILAEPFNHLDTNILRKKPAISNTELSIRAMSINDNLYFNNEHREKQLIELFKEYGHELSFTGEYGEIVCQDKTRTQ